MKEEQDWEVMTNEVKEEEEMTHRFQGQLNCCKSSITVSIQYTYVSLQSCLSIFQKQCFVF